MKRRRGRCEGARASRGDLLGSACRFPVLAEEVLSIGIDQVREVLVPNVLRCPLGRTFLGHNFERISKSLEERRM